MNVLVKMLITGGKDTDYRYDKEWGTLVRIWDVKKKYSRDDKVYLYFSDMVTVTLATADAEKKNPDFLTDRDCPIIWHFSSTNIANQGRWMNQVTKEWCEAVNPERIRVVWLPMNKPGINTNYATDVLEVADCWIKMKDLGRRYSKSVRVAKNHGCQETSRTRPRH